MSKFRNSTMERAMAGIDLEGLTVLEAGTGAGNMTWYLAEHHVKKVVSVSHEREQLQYAKSRIPKALHPRIEFLEADLRDLHMFTPETFDLITAHFLLNVNTPFDALVILQELSRVLRGDGRLAVIEYAPFDKATSSTSWIQQELWRLENALGVLLTGEPYYTEYPSEWLIDRLKGLDFCDVKHKQIAEDILWSEELLQEHAEGIWEELERLNDEGLSDAFKGRWERLLQASKGVEVRSGAIYALYAQKAQPIWREVGCMASSEELGLARPTFYFRYRGEVNTQKALELARERALELELPKMVVVSETGRSALKAIDVLKETEIKLIVVTHYPARTWGPQGDIPIGLGRPEYSQVKQFLEDRGVMVVQGTRPFAGVGRALGWEAPVPATFIDKTLELFGSGTKIAVEAALMATDAGLLQEDETVVTLGGTYKGLDTALAVRTSYSGDLFTEFEVLELIAKPHRRGKRLPEYEKEGWKGDLDQYYRKIELEG